MVEILPVYSAVWNDSEGCYEEIGEQIGFKALDARGEVMAYGETETEAFENAMEAQWEAYRRSEEGTPPSAAVVAR